MKSLRTARLHLATGGGDKVYDVTLLDTEAGDASARYLVNVRYGKRGGTLQESTKTPKAVALDAAERLFDSIVVAKFNEGYQLVSGDGLPAELLADKASVLHLGRTHRLLEKLERTIREPFAAPQQDRLFWRVGEVAFADALPLLLKHVERLGFAQVSYSLVWALVRCGGADAYGALKVISTRSSSPLVANLASFALTTSMMGSRQRPAEPIADLPQTVIDAWAANDVQALLRAFLAFMKKPSEPGSDESMALKPPPLVHPDSHNASRYIIALYHLAQTDARLHGLLLGLMSQLPLRPPFVPAFRRLFKYAEMIEDAPMFGVIARRFESAKPMYGWSHQWQSQPHAYIPEFGTYHWQPLTHLQGAPDAVTALSKTTVEFLKRRVWRALRKRGELHQESYLELATTYLLAFGEHDLVSERLSQIGITRHFGPLSYAWSLGNILYRHASKTILHPRQLAFNSPDPWAKVKAERGEAFPQLWRDHPEYALKLAMISRCEPIALFGLSLLKDQPEILPSLSVEQLISLLVSPFEDIIAFALEETRARLENYELSTDWLATLLHAATPAVRALGIRYIEDRPHMPWQAADLAFYVLIAPYEDVLNAASGWSTTRAMTQEVSRDLAYHLAQWLLAAGANVTEDERGRLRYLRRSMAQLWKAGALPWSSEIIGQLMAHPAPEVIAIGLDALGLSGAGAGTLTDSTLHQLLASPSPDIQMAALGLLRHLSDTRLAPFALTIAKLIASPHPEVRQATRPLVADVARRFPSIAADLARQIIDTLFQTAPDEGYAQDAVTLLCEALPDQVSALDINLLWRLLSAKAKGARLLGATLVVSRQPSSFSVKQLARLGNHAHVAVREWVMAAFKADPARMLAEAPSAVLLVESDWEDAHDFALGYFNEWPAEVWTPEVLGVVADSVKPKVLAFAREVLRRTLDPQHVSDQLTRLLEHPAATMHLLITEILTSEAVQDETVFIKVLPLSRIVLMQAHKARVAKDRLSAFLHGEALKSQDRASRIAPIFADLSLSVIEQDRTRAVLALRDIEGAFPDLSPSLPLKRVAIGLRGRP